MVTHSTKTRTLWVDIAKAIAIVLVVLYHSALFLVADDLTPEYWTKINRTFQTFRMPLFFFAAGLFASSVINRSWAMLWKSRLALLAWTFILWTVLRYAFFWIVPSPLPLDESNPVLLLMAPVWPQTGLWFLHALAIFFVAAKAMKVLRIPPVVQVVGAALVSAAFFAGVSVGNISYNGMFQYFVFFLTACHYREQITQGIQSLPRWSFIVAGLAFGAIGGAAQALGSEQVYGVMFVVSAAAVIAGLTFSRAIENLPGASKVAWVGEHTLPIYVSHVLIIAGIAAILGQFRDVHLIDTLGPLLPIAVAALALALSLALWGGLTATRMGSYFYSPPALFSRA
ncbi:acyltransferase [Rhodococcus sp. MS16]|uniref:acyltransferase family protein n=1 Tax=Rhodococcus TaxID=1827 RepID=UPI001561FA23|nr:MULTISPECIES: acyltransferase family protein [Rhodococcus]MCE4268212.1 acyltransferase family protein [Rhodococcus globerulus]NRI66968.1 acyltransferase [Rhodococcus sp. MS16]